MNVHQLIATACQGVRVTRQKRLYTVFARSHEEADAISRKITESGPLTKETLREAVIEGALLRLRPKVMTVATVVAGLLPIMWSTRTGAEVMKPLATPVLGGMVSSLVHVLIVTPVIFTWLRQREITRSESASTPLL